MLCMEGQLQPLCSMSLPSQEFDPFIHSFSLLCFFLLFLKNLFIYLFLAALGLRCCARAFSSCGKQGLLFFVVRRLLIVMASHVAEQWL